MATVTINTTTQNQIICKFHGISFIKHCKTTKFLLFRRFIKLNLQIYIIFAYYFKHSTTMMKEFFQLMRRFVAPYKSSWDGQYF